MKMSVSFLFGLFFVKVFVLFFSVSFLLLMLLNLFFFFLKGGVFYSTVNTIYKWASASVFLGIFFMFESQMMYFFLFQETCLWLSYSPLFVLDTTSLFFYFFALLVSWSIMTFSVDYMCDEAKVLGFLSYLILFLFFMFLLVFSGNFIVLFVSWEGVGLLSFLLISWWGCRAEAVSGSMQAVIYNRISDAGLLVFLVFYLVVGNNLYLSSELVSPVFFFLFLLGVLAKSSQLFFHPWLPNAMEGPTPVSSLLHSSTMVVASVYLLMRCLSTFSHYYLVFVVSVLTCLVSGAFGFNQFDFKKVVAYSTTSQLGFMMTMLSLGFTSFCGLYMMAHAFFKAMIFMMSGVVIHMAGGAQDFRGMNVMVLMNNFMMYLYMFGGVVMMGLPFLSAFWIKDLVLEETNFSYLGIFFWGMYVSAVLMTSLYSVRLYLGLFSFSFFSQKKLMVGVALESFYPYVRLFVGSLISGLLFYMFYGPMGHVLLTFFIKFFSVVVIVVGVCLALFLLRGGAFGFLELTYLLFYNPLLHKSASYVLSKVSELCVLLDFLLMEYFFFSSIIGSRRFFGFFRLVFVFIVILYFLLGGSFVLKCLTFD